MTATMDEDRVMQFMGQVITDAGAALSGLTVSLGDRLGLYATMAGAGPLTSVQLAERSELVERYVREWLACQVAGGYVTHDAAVDTYTLPDEHSAVLADPLAPTYLAGMFLMLDAAYATEDRLVAAFRTGDAVGWTPTLIRCSPAPPSSSGPATSPTSPGRPDGWPRSTGWRTSSPLVPRWPIWGVGSAIQPC